MARKKTTVKKKKARPAAKGTDGRRALMFSFKHHLQSVLLGMHTLGCAEKHGGEEAHEQETV